MSRPSPKPPHPDIVRQPTARFGWLDDRLLYERWLADLGTEAVAVLVLLALAADSHGASFFGEGIELQEAFRTVHPRASQRRPKASRRPGGTSARAFYKRDRIGPRSRRRVASGSPTLERTTRP